MFDKSKRIQIVCHKGANEQAPENTFAAARLCVDWGIDYVEIDVNTSKDGVLYLMHGPEVDRTTNGSGLIVTLLSEEIDQLDAGSWFAPRFAGERVLRLDSFLKWIKGKSKVFLDVKAADHRQLIDLVYGTAMEKDCFFWSGDDGWTGKLRLMNPELQIMINVKNPFEVRKAVEIYGANIVQTELPFMNEEMVDTCNKLGAKLMIVHLENDAAAFDQILEWGADLVNCNHGDVFKMITREFYGD